MAGFSTINPTTGETIANYEHMADDQVSAAIENCHKAFLDWRHASLSERAEVMRAIGRELRQSKDEFAELMVREVGKLLRDSRDEIELCAAICDWTAENGPTELSGEERQVDGAKKSVIAYAPIGIVYGIQPWNFPCYQAVRYSIANLMAGNGVLLKHAESCTGSGLFLRDVYERAGLPKNLFSVLLIDHDQSDTVIENQLVRGVTLTGSDRAGRIVAAKAGEQLKKTVLELGSNDAYLVLDDADLDLAVETCVTARIYNNGQTCVNGKRFVVVDKVYDEFVDRYVAAMDAVKLGDPMQSDTQLGPMARAELRETLHEQVRDSVEKGARIRCGGQMPDGEGVFYPATVLTEVAPGQPAYDDELFGPVASVIRAKDNDDAMRIANDSRYGLGGGIFSKDAHGALERAKEHFDTGMVCVNGYAIAKPNMPFGGVKDSGYGREHGGFGMKEFVNIKAISVIDNASS